MKNEEVLAESTITETYAEPVSDYETERNKPMPNTIHGVIQRKLSALLDKYENQYLIASEVTLNTTPASTPDLVISKKRKLRWKDMEAKEKEAPIATIEILSPSQTIDDLLDKARDVYFPMGVKSAWLIIPPIKTVTILTPDENQSVFNHGEMTDSVTGIKLSVEAIFECMD